MKNLSFTKKPTLLFSFILISNFLVGQTEEWRIVSEAPIETTLNEVQYIGSNDVYGVGNNGVFVKGTFNETSATWDITQYDLDGYDFRETDLIGLSFLNLSSGFIALDANSTGTTSIYYTRNGGGDGDDWKVVDGSDIFSATGSNIKKIHAVDESTLWVVAKEGVYLWEGEGKSLEDVSPNTTLVPSPGFAGGHFIDANTAFVIDGAGQVLKTTDGGSSWSDLSNYPATNASLVYFSDASNGIVISSTASRDKYANITTDGGISWSTHLIGNVYGSPLDISFHGQTGYVSINRSIYTSSDGGVSWSEYDMPESNPALVTYNSIVNNSSNKDLSFLMAGSGLAQLKNGETRQLASFLVSDLKDIKFLTKDTGFVLDDQSVLKTTDGGFSWSRTEIGEECYEMAFSPTNPSIGYIFSFGNSIYKTTNGGDTWNELNSNGITPTFGDDTYFKFIDDTKGFLYKENGFLFKTTDGGLNWSLVNLPNRTTVTEVEVVDENLIYHGTGSSALYKTTDGGANWSLENQVGSGKIYDIEYVDTNTILYSNLINVYVSSDGGETFNSTWVSNQGIGPYAIHAESATNWYIIAREFVVKTEDGGASFELLDRMIEYSFNPQANDNPEFFFQPESNDLWLGSLSTLLHYSDLSSPATQISVVVDDVNLEAGDEFSVGVSVNGALGPDNKIGLELSDQNGDFTEPTLLFNESISSGGIVFVSLPQTGLVTGSGYRIRAIAASPSITSGPNAHDITITAPNSAPTAITLSPTSIDENAGADAVVGDLGTTDADAGDEHTYELVADFGDNNAFSIDNVNDQLLANSSFDYETQTSYSIKIRSTDDAGDFVEEEFTIEVNDVDEKPNLVSVTPDYDATQVGLDASLTLTFDKDISGVGTSGSLRIFNKATGLQFRQFSSGSFTVDITGPTITIDLPGGVYFPAGGEFYVLVEEDFVTSAVDFSESWEGIQDEETWTFSTIPRLQITSVSPEGSADPQNLELSIDFDQNITQSAVNTKRLRIRRVSDDETVSFYRGSDFAINGSTATVNVDGDLLYNTDYYVTIDDNIFVQEGEPRNSNPVVDDPSFWTFTTINAPNNAPTAISLAPSFIDENAGADAVVGDLSTTDADAGDTHTYELVAGFGDNSVFSIDNSNDQLLANSSFDYEAKNSYSIKIRSTDDAGDFVEEEFTIEVNDLDEIAPFITEVSPANGANGVKENPSFTVTFSETIFKANPASTAVIRLADLDNESVLPTSFYPTPSGTEITFTLSEPLKYGTTYGVYIAHDGYEDAAGNLPGNEGNINYPWAFTTREDPAPPTVDGTSPADNAMNVSKDATLSVTFSETIEKADPSGTIEYVLISRDGSLVETINGSDVSIFDDELRVDDHDPFTAGSNYSIVVAADVLTDTNGNPFDAFEGDQTVWNFSVAKDDQVISLDPISDKLTTDAPFDIQATVDSGLPLTYSVTGPATNEDATITLTGESGTVEVTVTQEGSEQYNAASVTTSFTVNDPAKTDQTITFEALTDKTFGDAPFDLTATASSGLPVSFTVISGPASVTDNTVTITGAGEVTVEATQAGDDDYNAATPVQQSFTVNKAAQSITFDALANKTFGDVNFNLEATASSELPVSYTSSDESVATVSGSTVTIIGAGSTNITASQAGNDNYLAATEVVQTLTVDKAAQTITFEDIPDQQLSAGSVELSATSSAGLAIDFTLEEGDGSISGTTLTFNSTGTYTVSASQAGTANIAAASATQSFTVSDESKQDQVITFETVTDKTFGDAPFELSARSDSGLPVAFSSSNQNVVTIEGTTATIVGAGEVTLFANQTGDDTFNPAPEQSQTITVSKADQTITFEALAESTFGDPAIELTAASTSSLPVTYESSNTSVATVSGSTLTIVGAGTTSITASQAGNSNYNAATPIVQELIVAKAMQTVTFDEIADQDISAGSVALSATASSNLTVDFILEAGDGTINGNILTFNGTGTYTVNAIQSGNDNYLEANVRQTFLVSDNSKQSQTITFEAIGNQTYGEVLAPTATASSELGISFSIVSGPATVSAGEVTFTGIGTVTIEANQAGDADFNPAPSVEQSFEVLPATLEVTADDQTNVYNEAIPALTYSIIGFVNNEDETVLNTTPIVSTTATTGDDAGTYAITVSGGEAANYAFTYTDGTLTIEKAQATVTLSHLEQEADGTAKLPTVTTDPADLNFTITFDGGEDAPVEAGEYLIEVVIDETNYQGSVSGTFVLTGSEDVLSISGEVSIKVYPNPVIDFLKISGNLTRVRLMDLDGKAIVDQTPNSKNTDLDLLGVSEGVYLLELTDQKSRIIMRRIIKK